MNKIKLLTPILGLNMLSTIVVPLTTSCSCTTVTNHIKVSPLDEKAEENSIAQYLLILDSRDYSKNRFVITVKVDDTDISGAKSSDFTIDSWNLDQNQLLVNVKYMVEGEQLPEVTTTIKLNITVSYGDDWKETVNVKFIYTAEGIVVIDDYWSESFSLVKGKNYILSWVCNETITSEQVAIVAIYKPDWSKCPFKDVKVKCNGLDLDENNYSKELDASGNLLGIVFDKEYRPQEDDIFLFKFITSLESADTVAAARVWQS